MSEINVNDFLEELRSGIQQKKRIEAKLVLSKIEAVDDQTRKMALFELMRSADHPSFRDILDIVK